MVQADQQSGFTGTINSRHETGGFTLQALPLVIGKQLERHSLRVGHPLQEHVTSPQPLMKRGTFPAKPAEVDRVLKPGRQQSQLIKKTAMLPRLLKEQLLL